ncbi:DUF2065 domain-containing protein [Acidovorax sp. SRB_14]|uniref:DUF2065 domain-containing protein n=1 Tax=unclassified Acidovorax TaxID=2684926 RepID=UPI00145D89C1|nr:MULTISPECIES: DUF2065 domain-containing protein [unclassified Acidovorax]NMM77840.1 DUF2065 domain-containing protein [Acidovorax sp. SRB_24]NMM82517.1 DUF2065 domain-containing protein [Acidovorax sp. SRB_14]NMM89456.1 DUF2065 domain-containing protein [Rhodococcus sp. SRB_17]
MEWSDCVWTAVALILVMEGLLPFLFPAGWRRLLTQLMQLRDGQIRFFALLCIVSGAAVFMLR